MSMWKTFVILFVTLSLPGWAQHQVEIGQVRWYTDYDQAMKVARREGKPLWLHFGENPG